MSKHNKQVQAMQEQVFPVFWLFLGISEKEKNIIFVCLRDVRWLTMVWVLFITSKIVIVQRLLFDLFGSSYRPILLNQLKRITEH